MQKPAASPRRPRRRTSRPCSYYYDWVEGNLEATSPRRPTGKRRLPPCARHAAEARPERVRQILLPADVRKKALVIDMRGNGGGNVSPHAHREAAPRASSMINDLAQLQPATPTPAAMIYGPMVTPAQRVLGVGRRPVPVPLQDQHKLGKLIGKRSPGAASSASATHAAAGSTAAR